MKTKLIETALELVLYRLRIESFSGCSLLFRYLSAGGAETCRSSSALGAAAGSLFDLNALVELEGA